MLSLSLPKGAPLRVLCLGAHCDDVEIGCAGTLMTLQERHPGSHFNWVVFTQEPGRERETRDAAARIHGESVSLEVLDFRMSYLPYEGAKVKDRFEAIKARIQPDLVFTHRLEDRHQDHRLMSELTWNTFRDHVILEYEIPKYEGDLGHPNVFVPLEPRICQAKIALLMQYFGTQRSKRWFTEDLFAGLMRLRGIEAGLANGGAEGFYARKLLFNPAPARDDTR